MPFGDKIDQIFKQFMYEQKRSKSQHSSWGTKKNILGSLSEILDEMEEYIDQKAKEYEIFKKK